LLFADERRKAPTSTEEINFKNIRVRQRVSASVGVLLLITCFFFQLLRWIQFGLNSGLFSYTLLIPFISGYFIWLRRKEFAGAASAAKGPAAVLAVAGTALLISPMPVEYRLASQMLSFCIFLWAGGFLFYGQRKMSIAAFPALFLIFMAPIPEPFVTMLEVGLQHMSAGLAYVFIKISGIPVYRVGLDFHMPRIALSVAPECSGIRSSLILFLTSLIAGHMFLRKGWTRWVLALIVVPLGVARNAFRILVLAMLCNKVDVSYIHSPIHHHGGPVFFILSLIPFGLILFLLRRFNKGFVGSKSCTLTHADKRRLPLT
jgi:exosortase C (VPDSG-CTERM-specific)